MQKRDDAGIGPGFAGANVLYRGAAVDRVAVKNRMREAHVAHAQVGDCCAKGGVLHRQADHQAERENAVDQGAAELGGLAVFGVDVQRSRVAGGVAEPHVVALRDGAPDFVVERLPDAKLFIPKSGHQGILK